MLDRRSLILSAAAGLGAMAVMPSDMLEAAAEPTMSMNVVYPNHAGAKFDLRYYRDVHVPMVLKIMKAESALLIEGVSMTDAQPPFAMIGHFRFASAEALKAGLADPGMAELRADVAKFTDIKPTVMFGKSST